MSKVLKFPKQGRTPPEQSVVGEVVEIRQRSALSVAASAVGRALGSIMFMLLLWLRGPIHGILCLLAAAGMIAGVVLWLGSGYARRIEFMWISFGLSFGSFVLAWLYDSLLRWLSPVPLYLS